MRAVFEVDDEDKRILLGCLRHAHTQTLDALAACAHAPHYPDFKQREPNYEQADKCRDVLNRVEQMAAVLGEAIYSTRRLDVERFFRQHDEEWKRVKA